MYNNLPTVAILGRENVGKSTLFNRLIEKRKAITSQISGTTRDRNYGICFWRGQKIHLIDTGGMNINSENKLKRDILNQSLTALKQADIIVLVIDGQIGLLPADKDVTQLLRKTDKPVVLAINKIDNPQLRENLDLNLVGKLGFENYFLISAANGSGIGDMLDDLIKLLPAPEAENVSIEKPIKISIIGKPNVGKSSLLNKILNEDRAIVSAMPHTTREPQDAFLNYKGNQILIADTAGIRRKSKIIDLLEKAGVHQSLKYLRKADIILFVVDVNLKVSAQDKRLADLIVASEKSVIILANKYDLIPEKDTEILQKYEIYFKKNFPHLSFAPMIFISAKTNFNLQQVLEKVLMVKNNRQRLIPADELKNFIQNIRFNQPQSKNKNKKNSLIHDLVQTETNPPHFNLYVSRQKNLAPAVLNIIEKKLYQNFNLSGTPIKIIIKDVNK
ncbi:MAG: ribosome biogenesis GTPase Der [Patescibacteria group bacterium]|nr:ribosome biogenesis GTPase Der [Patescibacteria group bacterium]